VRRGEHDEVYWLGAGFTYFPEAVASYIRVPAGHNEDYFPALANLHTTMERMIRQRRGETVPDPYPHPGADEGAAGMRFVEAAVQSSAHRGAWTDI
jgi:hypothetical protein